VKGHGLSSQAFQRQFDLGQLFLSEVPDDDKQRLHARIWEGDWSGYEVSNKSTPFVLSLLSSQLVKHVAITSVLTVPWTITRRLSIFLKLGHDAHVAQYCDFYPYTIVEDRLSDVVNPFIQEIREFTHASDARIRVIIILMSYVPV
jgi:hypothetical protein